MRTKFQMKYYKQNYTETRPQHTKRNILNRRLFEFKVIFSHKFISIVGARICAVAVSVRYVYVVRSPKQNTNTHKPETQTDILITNVTNGWNETSK